MISRATTYLTEPLDVNGDVDYLVAINAMLSAGVTPENNFEVAYPRYFGPNDEPRSYREQYFRALKIDAPPFDDSRFTSLWWFNYRSSPGLSDKSSAEMNAQHIADNRLLELCQQERWSAETHPQLAAWLKGVEPHLERLIAASRRPHRHAPLLEDERYPGISEGYLDDSEFNDATAALRIRALFRAESGRLDDAISDLEASYRIARLFEQSRLDGHQEQGTQLRNRTNLTVLGLLEPGDVSRDQIQRLRQARAAAPPPDGKTIPYARLQTLDLALKVRRYGPKPWFRNYQFHEDVAGVSLPKDRESTWPNRKHRVPRKLVPLQTMLQTKVDWNEVLRQINRHYDQIEALPRRPLLPSTAELKALGTPNGPTVSEAMKADRLDPTEATRWTVDILLSKHSDGAFFHEFDTARGLTRTRLSEIGFELAEYRSTHGDYPERLEQLATIPGASPQDDPWTGETLKYRREGTGYILYSVGENYRDDDGRHEWVKTTHKDDISMRMPIPTTLDALSGRW